MNKGFTLLELMITVVIVAILAMVALPSYQEHVRSTRREDGKQALMTLAQYMEHTYATNLRYSDVIASGAYPANVPNSGTAYYTLSVSVPQATTYTVSATPSGAQASDKCGVLSISRNGTKLAKKSAVDVTSQCW